MIIWGGNSGVNILTTGGKYCAIAPETPTPSPTPTPPPTATATPTPVPTVAISGTITYCSNPVPGPISNVAISLTGTTSEATSTDGSGFYSLAGLVSGGNYTVTPTKGALSPGTLPGINTVDVVAVQRHFLNLGQIPPGCRLAAANVNGDTTIDTVDVIAIERFFLAQSTGIANVGKYEFTPAVRTYSGIANDQTAENYNALIFGDVAAPFVH